MPKPVDEELSRALQNLDRPEWEAANAFPSIGSLSARFGAILLVENQVERPLLSSNVGMGARIVNYFRYAGSSLEDERRHAETSPQGEELRRRLPNYPREKSEGKAQLLARYDRCPLQVS